MHCSSVRPQQSTRTVQHEQLGTGHAVLQARSALPRASDDVLVLYGDTPLLRPETARAVVELRRSSGALVDGSGTVAGAGAAWTFAGGCAWPAGGVWACDGTAADKAAFRKASAGVVDTWKKKPFGDFVDQLVSAAG